MSGVGPLLMVKYLKDRTENGDVSFSIAPIGAAEVSDQVLIINSVQFFIRLPSDDEVRTQIGYQELPDTFCVLCVSFGCDLKKYYYTTCAEHGSFPCIPIHTQVFEYKNEHVKMYNAGLLGDDMKYKSMKFLINYEMNHYRDPRFDVSIEFESPDLVVYNRSQLVYYGPSWDGPRLLPP